MIRILVGALTLLGLLAPAAEGAKRGGTVTFRSASDVDYVDPGQTYYTFGYALQFAVNRPLYGFRPGGTAPEPDLAAGPPEISADRRTVTVRIRPGVRYAPPVNREVVAGDVKYAMQRAFSRRVPSGYAHAYFSGIVDAPRRATRGIPTVAGIETPDDRTLVFRLRRATGETFAASLVMPITVPVPPEVARRHDRRSPTTYDRRVAFTGPYVVASRRPGRSIVLRRNPNWDPATDHRPAHLDRIVFDQRSRNLRRAARSVVAGSGQLCCDAGPPGVRGATRVPALGTRYVALNTRRVPLRVRRAIMLGLDRRRLARLRRAPLARHFLPPGIPGHAETGDVGPAFDRGQARRLLRGTDHRKRRLLIVGGNRRPDRPAAISVNRQLRRLGFRTRLRLVPRTTMFTRYCGVPRRRVDVCPSVGWFADFIDPANLLQPTFDGDAIRRVGNVNWPQLDVPAINRAMDAAETTTGADRAAAWAAINRDVLDQAAAVPISWDENRLYASGDLEAQVNPYTTTWDLGHTGYR